jgi:hypothetical protein
MTKEFEHLMQIFATAQAAYTIGIVSVILYYYFSRAVVTKRIYKINMTLLTFSYLLIMLATAITLYRSPYHMDDPWYWIVGTGYLLCDISILYVFKIQIDKSIRERALGDLSKEIEEEIERLKQHRDAIQSIAKEGK